MTRIVNFTIVESIIFFFKTQEKNDLNWTQTNMHAATENFLIFDIELLKKALLFWKIFLEGAK